jgi:hypothetical protein
MSPNEDMYGRDAWTTRVLTEALARIAGGLYLSVGIFGACAIAYVTTRTDASGHAAATAAKLLNTTQSRKVRPFPAHFQAGARECWMFPWS